MHRACPSASRQDLGLASLPPHRTSRAATGGCCGERCVVRRQPGLCRLALKARGSGCDLATQSQCSEASTAEGPAPGGPARWQGLGRPVYRLATSDRIWTGETQATRTPPNARVVALMPTQREGDRLGAGWFIRRCSYARLGYSLPRKGQQFGEIAPSRIGEIYEVSRAWRCRNGGRSS